MTQASTGIDETRTGTDLHAALLDLSRRYNLVALYAFGSRAREIAARLAGDAARLTGDAARMPGDEANDAASGSDVDIGVLPPSGTKLSVGARVEVSRALEDLFDVHRVDLVVLPEADPFLAANVIRGERLCTLDAYTADEYDLYVLRRAGDLAPLERERIALILGEDA